MLLEDTYDDRSFPIHSDQSQTSHESLYILDTCQTLLVPHTPSEGDYSTLKSQQPVNAIRK